MARTSTVATASARRHPGDGTCTLRPPSWRRTARPGRRYVGSGATLVLSARLVVGNRGGGGGGLSVQGGTLVVTDSTVRGNGSSSSTTRVVDRLEMLVTN